MQWCRGVLLGELGIWGTDTFAHNDVVVVVVVVAAPG